MTAEKTFKVRGDRFNKFFLYLNNDVIKQRMRFVFVASFLFSLVVSAVDVPTAAETSFVAIYQPVLKSMGLTLEIQTNEDSADYYGGASLEPGVFRISIGEIIRKDLSGTLAYTLCHEVGHLLGGEPKKPTSTWASTEAQSDFYATSVCLKKIYQQNPNLLQGDTAVHSKVTRVCGQTYANTFEKRICERIAQDTFLFFTDVWTYINFSGITKPSFQVETSAAAEKGRNYPSLQCRLEIGFAGALCNGQSCTKPACF